MSARKTPQTLLLVENFLTSSDWQVLEATGTAAWKVNRLMDRLLLLGLSHPSEATTKRVAAVVALHHFPQAEPRELHNLVGEVKTAAAHRKSHDTGLSNNFRKTFPNPCFKKQSHVWCSFSLGLIILLKHCFL